MLDSFSCCLLADTSNFHGCVTCATVSEAWIAWETSSGQVGSILILSVESWRGCLFDMQEHDKASPRPVLELKAGRCAPGYPTCTFLGHRNQSMQLHLYDCLPRSRSCCLTAISHSRCRHENAAQSYLICTNMSRSRSKALVRDLLTLRSPQARRRTSCGRSVELEVYNRFVRFVILSRYASSGRHAGRHPTCGRHWL